MLGLILALGVGFIGGAGFTRLPSAFARTSDDEKILVHGYGTAISTEKPPGQQFTLIASNAPNRSFKVVPPGKTFILTDMVYNARGVRQNLTVNLANGRLIPEKPNVPYVADILLQIYLKPTETQETHLCTGYVIPSGNSVMAWTNAGLEADQSVQVAVTGYLINSTDNHSSLAVFVGISLAPKVGLSSPAAVAAPGGGQLTSALGPQIIPAVIGGVVGGVAC